jgi:hypothetical protein
MVAAVVAIAGFAAVMILLPRVGDHPADAGGPDSEPAATEHPGGVGTEPAGVLVPGEMRPVFPGPFPTPEDSPFPILPPAGEDAALAFSVAVEPAPGGGSPPSDGEELIWRFEVRNEGSENVWGVYVHLELRGPATCGTSRLAPGESTRCVATTTAFSGSHTAWAWVTAWTRTAIIGTDLFHDYEVVP